MSKQKWKKGKVLGTYVLICDYCNTAINEGDNYFFQGQKIKCIECHLG